MRLLNLLPLLVLTSHAYPANNQLIYHWDFLDMYVQNGNVVVPEKITKKPEFFLGKGARHSPSIAMKDPFISVFGSYWSSSTSNGQALVMAPTLNFDYQNSFAFEFWFWVPESTSSDWITLLSIAYRYNSGTRFKVLLSPSGGLYIFGMCYPNFNTIKLDKNWNLLVIDVGYIAPTTTITTRITSAEGTQEVAKTCSGSFTSYFASAPRDDLVFMVGSYFNGYNAQHTYPFQGYMRHIKYYKGFNMFLPNDIKGYIKAYDGINCAGDPPCKICYSNPLTAATQPCEGRQAGNGLYLHINFLENSNEEYFEDETGNGYHFWKDSDQNSQISNKVLHLVGQGVLLKGKDHNPAKSTFSGFQFTQDKPSLNTFTMNAWFRVPGFYYGALPHISQGICFIVDITSWLTHICLSYYPANAVGQRWVFDFKRNGHYNQCQLHTQGSTSPFEGNEARWHYIEYSSYIYKELYEDNEVAYHAIRMLPENQYCLQKTNFNNLLHDDTLKSKTLAFFYTDLSVIVRDIKLYNFPRNSEIFSEAHYTTDGTNHASCAAIGNQGGCATCLKNDPKCFTKCAYNQYGNNCGQCHPFCETCTGPLLADCLTCTADETLRVITSAVHGNCTCEFDLYHDTSDNTCKACNAACDGCYGSTNQQCLSCAPGYMLMPGTDECIADCSFNDNSVAKLYYWENTAEGICDLCHPSAVACTGPDYSDSISCADDFYFQAATTSCVSVCGAGQYSDFMSNSCLPCHADCSYCTGPLANDCTSCSSPTKFKQAGACVDDCDPGKAKDLDKMTCSSCHLRCDTCQDLSYYACPTCAVGYFQLYGTLQCESYCYDGYYGNTGVRTCEQCDSTCETCDGPDSDNCLTCRDDMFKLNDVSCVTTCPDGMLQERGECIPCHPNCNDCFGVGVDECTKCSGSNVLFQTTCSATCPDSYYLNTIDNSCSKCPDVCSTCTAPDQCTGCIHGPYILIEGSCQYFNCIAGTYRAISPQLACYDCHESCTECYGDNMFTCTKCGKFETLKDGRCLTCEDYPGMKTPSDPFATQCMEIRGDGFNYGNYQCDDGNLQSGDGCSPAGSVEAGFSCSGGSSLTPDVCRDSKPPEPSIALVSAENSVYIVFEAEEVYLTNFNVDETKLRVSVEGSMSSYNFQWEYATEFITSDPMQKFRLDLTFYQTLIGDGSEVVIVEFLDGNLFKDAAGNSMLTTPLKETLNAFEYIDPLLAARLNSSAGSAFYTSMAIMAINLSLSIVFGGSLDAMWTMVNLVQLISLLPLQSIPYPATVVIFFKMMLSSHAEPGWMPNVIADYLLNREEFTIRSYNDYYKAYGYFSGSFILNSGKKFVIMLMFILAYPFVRFMDRRYTDKHPYCSPWRTLHGMFTFSMPLRTFVIGYVSFCLDATLNLLDMPLETVEDNVSAILALTTAVIIMYAPVFLLHLMQKNYTIIQTLAFQKRYSSIIKELKTKSPIQYMYYPFFLIRRALFAITLVILANHPKIQIIFLAFQAIVMMIYICVVRPQLSKLLLAMNIISELLLIIVHGFSWIFLNSEYSEEELQFYGFILIGIIAIYLMINWVVVIYITALNVKEKCRQKRIKKLEAKKKRLAEKNQLKNRALEHVDRKEKLEERFNKKAEVFEKAEEERTLLQTHQKRAAKFELGLRNEYDTKQEEVDIKAFLAGQGLEQFYRPNSAGNNDFLNKDFEITGMNDVKRGTSSQLRTIKETNGEDQMSFVQKKTL